MNLYAIVARLLDYPEAELHENLAAARVRVAADPTLNADDRDRVLSVIDWMRGRELLELQAEYVDTFDTVPEHALYLTHHTFGDSRERGPALVELGEHYKDAGFTVRNGELPDYLPLMLEYAALLDRDDPDAARRFLGEAAPIVARIAGLLEERDSPFAPLLRFVAGRGRRVRAAA